MVRLLTERFGIQARPLGFFFLGIATSFILYVIVVAACPSLAHILTRTPIDAAAEKYVPLTYSEPVEIEIPAIDLDASFEAPLGINEDESVMVPKSYSTVGWYKHGPTPGERGPAVVLGHVDSISGPAVFFNLEDLKPDDLIYITRADGSVVTFSVMYTELYDRTSFPSSEVYGDIDYAGLRLITCTGEYDHGILRYSHNLVVFAKRIET